MNIATLAVQPDSKQVVRKGKLQIINLDTSESLLPAARMVRRNSVCKSERIQTLVKMM